MLFGAGKWSIGPTWLVQPSSLGPQCALGCQELTEGSTFMRSHGASSYVGHPRVWVGALGGAFSATSSSRCRDRFGWGYGSGCVTRGGVVHVRSASRRMIGGRCSSIQVSRMVRRWKGRTGGDDWREVRVDDGMDRCRTRMWRILWRWMMGLSRMAQRASKRRRGRWLSAWYHVTMRSRWLG